MKEEQGKKLDPNDPAVPTKPDKPTALSDEDLDNVAGGSIDNVAGPKQSTVVAPVAPTHTGGYVGLGIKF